MKKHLIGAVAATAVLSPIAAMAKTEVHFWHAFTGRLGELVAAQVERFQRRPKRLRGRANPQRKLLRNVKRWYCCVPRKRTAEYSDGL